MANKEFTNYTFNYEGRKQKISLFSGNTKVIGLLSNKFVICKPDEKFKNTIRLLDKRLRIWIGNKLVEHNLSSRFIMSLDCPDIVGHGKRGTYFDFDLIWQNINGHDLKAHEPFAKEIITQLNKELDTLALC